MIAGLIGKCRDHFGGGLAAAAAGDVSRQPEIVELEFLQQLTRLEADLGVVGLSRRPRRLCGCSGPIAANSRLASVRSRYDSEPSWRIEQRDANFAVARRIGCGARAAVAAAVCDRREIRGACDVAEVSHHAAKATITAGMTTGSSRIQHPCLAPDYAAKRTPSALLDISLRRTGNCPGRLLEQIPTQHAVRLPLRQNRGSLSPPQIAGQEQLEQEILASWRFNHHRIVLIHVAQFSIIRSRCYCLRNSCEFRYRRRQLSDMDPIPNSASHAPPAPPPGPFRRHPRRRSSLRPDCAAAASGASWCSAIACRWPSAN